MLGLVDRGFSIEGLDAEKLQVNAFTGLTGDIILFYFPKTDIHHAGEIVVTFPSKNMIVYECNYTPGTCGERLVMVDDPTIRGYLHFIGSEF